MPTYNAMPFLPEAVGSILSQSFDQFEFLIVNDGSTDGSKIYLDSLTDDRVRVIHQKNRGIVPALNIGIQEARFDWIARMDADDVALPHRFEKEVAFLERHPRYTLVSCAFGYIGTHSKRLKARHVQFLRSPPSYQPRLDPVILHQGVLYNRKAVVAVGSYREVKAAEDLDLWLRLDEACYQMASIPEILMLARVVPEGISTKNFIEQRLGWKYALACSKARETGANEPWQNEFRQKYWPRGWKRIHVEGARQFRLAGASWGANEYWRAGLRFFLSMVLRPRLAVSKFAIYFFNTRTLKANSSSNSACEESAGGKKLNGYRI